MQLSGGVLLMCIGIGLAVGGTMGGNAISLGFALGFIAGFATLLVTRRWANARRGRPTRIEVRIMMAAIVAEVVVFVALGQLGYFRPANWLVSWQLALAVVALHFIPMRWSHGPLILGLAGAILIWLGACFALHLGLQPMILGDGVLKLAFGAAMAAPLLRPRARSAPGYPPE
jgi:hypothetical protein